MNKLRFNEFIHEVIELGEDNFPSSVEWVELKNVFEHLSYGEVLIKIIDGDIESIRVTHHYKPIVVDKNEKVV